MRGCGNSAVFPGMEFFFCDKDLCNGAVGVAAPGALITIALSLVIAIILTAQ